MNQQLFQHSQIGQVAAGDIINHAQPLPSKTEADLQREFKEKTGIDNCPKAARLFLNDLLENHNFTVRHLRWAWFCKSIEFDNKTNKVKSNWTVANAVGKWFLVGFMALLMSISALQVPTEALSPQQHFIELSKSIAVPFIFTSFMLIFWHLPMKTAYRVRKVIEADKL